MGKPPTISGMARALGVNTGYLKQAIKEYSSATLTTDTYYGSIMAWALSQVEEYIESGMLTGEINASAAKFALKRFGWEDQPTSQNLSINLSVEQIDNKLVALLGDAAQTVIERSNKSFIDTDEHIHDTEDIDDVIDG